MPGRRDAVLLVKPATILRWHRQGFGILGERHRQRVPGEYAFQHHNSSRPHQGLVQRIAVPKSRQICRDANKVVAIPVLGGLHHDYLVAA